MEPPHQRAAGSLSPPPSHPSSCGKLKEIVIQKDEKGNESSASGLHHLPPQTPEKKSTAAERSSSGGSNRWQQEEEDDPFSGDLRCEGSPWSDSKAREEMRFLYSSSSSLSSSRSASSPQLHHRTPTASSSSASSRCFSSANEVEVPATTASPRLPQAPPQHYTEKEEHSEKEMRDVPSRTCVTTAVGPRPPRLRTRAMAGLAHQQQRTPPPLYATDVAPAGAASSPSSSVSSLYVPATSPPPTRRPAFLPPPPPPDMDEDDENDDGNAITAGTCAADEDGGGAWEQLRDVEPKGKGHHHDVGDVSELAGDREEVELVAFVVDQHQQQEAGSPLSMPSSLLPYLPPSSPNSPPSPSPRSPPRDAAEDDEDEPVLVGYQAEGLSQRCIPCSSGDPDQPTEDAARRNTHHHLPPPSFSSLSHDRDSQLEKGGTAEAETQAEVLERKEVMQWCQQRQLLRGLLTAAGGEQGGGGNAAATIQSPGEAAAAPTSSSQLLVSAAWELCEALYDARSELLTGLLQQSEWEAERWAHPSAGSGGPRWEEGWISLSGCTTVMNQVVLLQEKTNGEEEAARRGGALLWSGTALRATEGLCELILREYSTSATPCITRLDTGSSRSGRVVLVVEVAVMMSAIMSGAERRADEMQRGNDEQQVGDGGKQWRHISMH